MTGRDISGPTIRGRLSARIRPLVRGLGPEPFSPRTGGRVDGFVASARDWAPTVPGASYQAIRAAETYQRCAPKTLTPDGGERLASLRQYESPEAFRAVVPGARLVDSYAPLVLTEDRRVFWESAFEHLRTPTSSHRRLHRPVHLAGRYMALLGEFWDNHFHWLADVLPRVSLLPLEEDSTTRVIVPANLSGIQLESLAMLGLTRDRLVPFEHEHIQVDELVFPSFVGRPGYPPPWAARWLRDCLVHDPPPPTRRLWVSRAGATRGRVTNEDEVMKVLSAYGFELVHTERLTWAEQLQAYSAAEMIIAPHGAGLANVVLSSSATVIELQSPRWWGQGCYYALADAAGLDYWFVSCEPTMWQHLRVNLELLGATVEAALDSRAAARK